MEIETRRQSRMFELKSTNADKAKGGVFGKGRLLLGRTESCDLIINSESISAVHAVMEIYEDRAKLYDMNSTNGTFVNNEKIVAKELRIGDKFRLADVEFEFIPYAASDSLPPVLDSLEPQKGSASVKVSQSESAKALPSSAPAVSVAMPTIVYPLASDPKAEFSEYIFEDKDELYPIFRYEAMKKAVEVIILFKDSVYSVDYLPEGKNTYYISGIQKSRDDLEFPYFGKTEKFPFVNVTGNTATVHTLPGFDVMFLSDSKKDTGHVGVHVKLSGQDLVRFAKGDIQIFVRNVAAPPKVLSAPILKRDPEFRKYLFIFMLFSSIFSVGINLIEKPEEEKKDELAPERLATILYKEKIYISKEKAVAKTVEAPKVAQQAPKKVAVKPDAPKEVQPDVQKPDVLTTKDQSKKPDPGKKTATEKRITKQGTQPIKDAGKMAKPIQTTTKATTSATAGGVRGAVSFSPTPSKSQGTIETYKSADFKSTVSSLMAKGGSLSGVSTRGASGGGGGDLTGASTGVGSGSGEIKTQGIATNQGSLVGATTGVLGDSKGAEGLSAKKAIYTAGIPSETVVLGSMDPDVIRRILLEHLPQFRYCYQKELERSGSELSGTVKLNFTIGASGHVAQAGVDGASNLPGEVKKCVVSVLRGIAFPEPMGGGTVEVKQPMNFYPKKM